MELVELNRDDCAALARGFEGDRQVHVHCMDGYQALKTFLPPRERRGLVLVDSSFDRAHEFQRLIDGLQIAYRRWATGVFARVVSADGAVRGARFRARCRLHGYPQGLEARAVDLAGGLGREGLRGCGMLIVNPPFGLDLEAQPMLQWVWKALTEGETGGRSVSWLVPE